MQEQDPFQSNQEQDATVKRFRLEDDKPFNDSQPHPTLRPAGEMAGARRSSIALSDAPVSNKLSYKDPRIRPLMLITFLTFFSGYFIMSVTTGFFPQIALVAPYNMSPSEIGVVFAVFQLAMAIVSPVASPLCNRLGRFPVLVLGILIQIAGTITFGLSDSAVWFGVSRAVQGIGGGFTNVACLALMVSNVENLEDAMGVQEVVTAVGFVLAVSMGSWIYSSVGFIWVFVICTVLLVMVLVLCFSSRMIYREHWLEYDKIVVETNEDTETPSETRAVLRSCYYNGVMFICGIASFQAFFSIAAVDPILGPHMEASLGVGTTAVGILFAGSDVFNVIGSLVGSTVCDAIGSKTTAVLGLVLTGFSFCLMGPAPYFDKFVTTSALSWTCMVIGAIGYGIGLAFAVIPLVPMMKDSVDDRIREKFGAISEAEDEKSSNFVSAVFNATSSIGQVVAPVTTGILVEYLPKRREVTCTSGQCDSGYQWTAFVLATGCVVVGLIVQLMVPTQAPKADSDLEEETNPLLSSSAQ